MALISKTWIGVLGAGVVLSAMALSTAGLAQTAPPSSGAVAMPDLDIYGRLPAFSSPRISPDGTKLAYLVPAGTSHALLIMDLKTAANVGGLRQIDNKVRGVDWIGNDHLLITTSTTSSIANLGVDQGEFSQGLIYSLADRSVQTIFARNSELARIMFGSPMIRQTPTGYAVFVEGLNGRDYTRSLYRVDPATNRATLASRGANVGRYLLDASGEPVARSTYEGEKGIWGVDAKRDGVWPRVWTVTAALDQPSLIGFGVTDRSVIVEAKLDGDAEPRFHALSLDTGEWSDLPFAKEPDSLIFHPVTKLLIGAVTGTDSGPQYEFLDPTASLTWRSVAAAFAGRNPSMVSWSANLRSILIQTDGNGDAGTYQLVDLDRHVAEIVGQSYPDLKPEQIGEIRIISYDAADGMEIPGYLTLPPGVSDPQNLPLVVMPHGGPAARDSFGFDWWAQAMASRGYAVLQPNFRGSDGLGEAHLQAGYGQWGRKMQSDLSDGVRWLAGQGIIDPKRVCIVGASYGGYAAMAGPTLDTGIYRCAVAVAGVSDLNGMIRWSAERAGQRNSPAVRYWTRFMGAGRFGDPALDALSPAKMAAQADAPILLIHGYDDTVVPYEQSVQLANALRRAGKPYELVPLPGEDHWLSSAATRQKMLAETLRFLEAHNPTGGTSPS